MLLHDCFILLFIILIHNIDIWQLIKYFIAKQNMAGK
jgi:hypothetical protein